jgi:phosphatidylglycerophosphate synthase
VTTRSSQDTDLLGVELTTAATAQLVLLLALWVTVHLHPVGWLIGTAYAGTTLVLLGMPLRREWARSLGAANRVTLARAILVGGVTALAADGCSGHRHTVILTALAAVALVLDAVDGQVARRTGTVTPLGARFDMEVDAFLILVLSVLVATALGPWVLVIGVLRYAFVAAGWLLPWLRGSLPTSHARKTVAAVQGITLVVAGADILGRPVAVVCVGGALASLVWSFGRDVVWLWRRRRTVRRGQCSGRVVVVDRQRDTRLDDVHRHEPDTPTRAALVTVVSPLDGRRAGQVQRGAGGEVHEQQARGRVDGDVAQAVEHVVAGVVGPPQVTAVHADEPGGTAPV